MNKALEDKLKNLPRTPGVYFHKSKSGEVIYVGKAAVLKNRVRQYFQSKKDFDLKTLALVNEIYDTDWIETESEIDALFLESEMVKRYMPRYNILLRDDKSQLFVRIDVKSEWPHVAFTRNPSDDGAEYFGPFYSGYAVKKALRYLRKIFPYYTKLPEKVTSRLDEDLGLNPKRSDGSDVYKQNLRKLISYIKGNRTRIAQDLEKEMKQAAKAHDFETAVLLRNKLTYLKELQRRVMFGDREFLDISKDRALSRLKELLLLSKEPARIEGYDISHMGGKNVVASMVVFTNGTSDRSQYRKFKTSERNDDTGNIYETLLRRFSPKNAKAWGLPELVLIDGGKGQLDAAVRALNEREIKVPIVSIAKREEELIIDTKRSNIDLARIDAIKAEQLSGVYIEVNGNYTVVNLHAGQRNASSHSKNLRGATIPSPYDDVVRLFQRIRDESHRFAVSYHTVLKRQKQTVSELDTIPGVGPATKRKLIKHFGSMRALREADYDSIVNIVGKNRAANIKASLSIE